MAADDQRRRAPLLAVEFATAAAGTANGVVSVALPWLVLERTGSAAAAGLLAALTAIPLLASSFVAGTIVDRFGRRRVSIASDLASAVSVALLPIVDAAWGLSFGMIAVLAVLGVMLDPVGITARETMLPEAADAARMGRERANGIHEAVWGAAFVVGPGMAGVLISIVGPVNTLLATTAAFVISAAVITLIPVPVPVIPDDSQAGQAGFVGETLQGLRVVWNDRVLRSMAIVMMVLAGLYFPIEAVLLPVYFLAQDAPERLGLLVVAMSGGGIIGALAYGAIGPRFSRRAAFVGSIVCTCVALTPMAFLPPFGIMLGFGVIVGVVAGAIGPLLNLVMQERSPNHLRGRVVGVITSLDYSIGPVGFLGAGAAVDAFGVKATFIAIAGGFLLVSAYAIASPALHELDAPVSPGEGICDTADG